jgi:hypothetical protein
MMSWTACYDDECYAHLGDKQGSGWFPTRKARSVCYSQGGPNYPFQEESSEESEDEAPEAPRFVEGEVISDSAAEESDEESDGGSEAENQSQPDELATAFPAGDITPIILRIIIRGRNEVFPQIAGRQHVNEDKLIDMYDDIRRAAAELPTVQGEVNYGRVLTERPPIGSSFTQRGGYATPEGVVICRTLRNKVKTLQDGFASEARLQRARVGLARRQDMPTFIEPLIEDGYMDTESGPGFYRPPTPSPSQSETPLLHRRSRPQPRDSGN